MTLDSESRARCPGCGRFLATKPERDLIFSDGSGVALAPVTYCRREKCVSRNEENYSDFKERTGG